MSTVHQKVCEACGRSFQAKRSDAKTCSNRCRAHKSRRKRDPLIGSPERMKRRAAGIKGRWAIFRRARAQCDLEAACIPMRQARQRSKVRISARKVRERQKRERAHDFRIDRLLDALDRLGRESCPPIPPEEQPWEWRQDAEAAKLRADASKLLLKVQGLGGLALYVPSLVNEPEIAKREFGIEPEQLRELFMIEEGARDILARAPKEHPILSDWRRRRRQSSEHRAAMREMRRGDGKRKKWKNPLIRRVAAVAALNAIAKQENRSPKMSVVTRPPDQRPPRDGSRWIWRTAPAPVEPTNADLLAEMRRQHEEVIRLLIAGLFGESPGNAAERILSQEADPDKCDGTDR